MVIGGGVLGLEAAWELKKAGLEVTVLEMAPSPMGRQMDESSGEQLKIIASKAGVVIRTGVNWKPSKETAMTGVRLKTGKWWKGRMVIVSCRHPRQHRAGKEDGIGDKEGE